MMPSGVYSGYQDSGLVQLKLRVTEEEYGLIMNMDHKEVCDEYISEEVHNIMTLQYN